MNHGVLRRCVTFVLTATIGSLGGCGGGGGGSTGAISTDQREAAIQAVHQKFASLPHTDFRADAQSMTAFMASRPEFAASGVSPDGTAWGRFPDGRLMLVTENRAADAQGRSTPPRLPTRLVPTVPNSITFRSFFAMGNAFNPAPADAANALLSAAGYAGIRAAGTLDDLKQMHGIGALYIDTHGGQGRDDPDYSICTATLWTKDIESTDDYKNGLLVTFEAVQDQLAPPQTRVGILPGFVAKYWSFAPNSVVYIDACDSNNASFKQACLDAGATVYFGWTNIVGDAAVNRTATALCGDLTGMTTPSPKQPPLNPRDYIQAFDDIRLRGLGTQQIQDAKGNAFTSELHATFVPADFASAEGSAAVPIIRAAVADDAAGTLTLTGVFPAQQGTQGGVTAGGTALNVRSWSESQVVTDEPANPMQIQVVADTRVSNILATASKLVIKPSALGVAAGDTPTLTAVLSNPPPVPLQFHWTTTGKNGTLAGDTGQTGTDITTATQNGAGASSLSSAITFKANPTLQIGAVDTVTVNAVIVNSAIAPDDKSVTPFGHSTATVSAGLTCNGPPPATLPPFGSGAGEVDTPAISLDKGTYQDGDLMTVSVSLAGPGADNSSWEVSPQGATGVELLDQLVSVDGVPRSGRASFSLAANATEQHTLVFRIHVPKDANGNPVTECAGGLVNNSFIGPLVFLTVFGQHGEEVNTVAFYNVQPKQTRAPGPRSH